MTTDGAFLPLAGGGTDTSYKSMSGNYLYVLLVKNGTCSVKPVTPSCTSPQYLDISTNTCVTPTITPPSCTSPQYLDISTNTCVTPTITPPSCTSPQYLDTKTNKCVTSTTTQTSGLVLLKPDNDDFIPLKKATKFTWQKATNAVKYRILFSKDKDFKNYDEKKMKCSNTDCFTYTTVSPSYSVVGSHKMLAQKASYFWKVQSIAKKTADNQTSDVRKFNVDQILPPSIISISATPQTVNTGEQVTLKATLDNPILAGMYSIEISIDGEQAQPFSTSTGTEFSLPYKAIEDGEHQFEVNVLDKEGNVIDYLGDSFVVNAVYIETFKSGDKTFSYTKIANDGSELLNTAQLGTGAKDWACTKDNNTGLIWQVQTSTDKFTWNNALTVATAVNSQGLCGKKDWRLPSVVELSKLLVCSDGKYLENVNGTISCTSYTQVTHPAINASYFPNTIDAHFWSSSPYANVSGSAWIVHFNSGGTDYNFKSNNGYVRLVRG